MSGGGCVGEAATEDAGEVAGGSFGGRGCGRSDGCGGCRADPVLSRQQLSRQQRLRVSAVVAVPGAAAAPARWRRSSNATGSALSWLVSGLLQR